MVAIRKINIPILGFMALKAPFAFFPQYLELSALTVNNQVLKFLMAKLPSANKA